MKKYLNSLKLIILLVIITNIDPLKIRSEEYNNTHQHNLEFSSIIYKNISQKKASSDFKKINLLSFIKNTGDEDNSSSSFVSKASILKLNKSSVQIFIKNKADNILFSIPDGQNTSMELELARSFPTSVDFEIKNKNNFENQISKINPGIHYNGIIKGNRNSIASLSIFEDFIMAVISNENGTYVLGSMKNQDNSYSENYIFYNDADLKIKSNFNCKSEDFGQNLILPFKGSNINSYRNSAKDNPARLPVKIYFEADYEMYSKAGSVQNLVNFITGMFNSVMTIYQNENIPFEISLITYWDSPDPYRNFDDSYNILLNFGANIRDDFQGNIAHFLSTRDDNLGGIAWIRVLCAEYNPNDSSGRYAFSNIEPEYSIYPTYSWTVNVVTHEMGHSLGSRHTHACVWPVNGNIQAIDSCYFSEGGCFSNSQLRARTGTIMSYCQLTSGGTNLALGFGPLPGDTIRLRYSQAGCFDRVLNSSERPTEFDLDQNFPNPFNPSTKIKFAIPSDANITVKIYDTAGKLITVLTDEFYTSGFYEIIFNSSGYNLSSGIYFYSLESNGKLIDTKRMVLIK